jgi:hypothetical protein
MTTEDQINAARAWVRFILPLMILAVYGYMLVVNHPALPSISQYATPLLAFYLSADGGAKVVQQSKRTGSVSDGVSSGTENQ